MAAKNFIPVLWETKILQELDEKHMLVKNCTTKYSGKITGIGSKVKINSINEPTIGDYVPNSTVITPEELQDESRMLEITQAKYFSFFLDDVDKKQSTGGLLEEGLRKAIIGLKNRSESFVASKFPLAQSTVTESALTSGNFFSTFMLAKTQLLANNVEIDDRGIVAEVSPEIWQKGVLADILFNNQNNGDKIETGYFVQSLGMTFFVSNNIPKVVTDQNIVQADCVVRTKEAIAYAEQIMKVEKYRPESAFSDAVKGLHVYGAKEIKPREMVYMDLTTAAETTI